MELPHLGKQCPTCKKLDFLPMKCDGCSEIFCIEHFSNHNCPSAYKRDVQVPVCPLCNILIPVPRGQLPDIIVGAHIENDCQSDPAKSIRNAYVHKCSTKGCKIKEIVPVLCQDCEQNFCFKHRHPSDHKCEGKTTVQRRRAAEAALTRQSTQKSKATTSPTNIQENLSEDGALARALALSMQENAPRESQSSQQQPRSRLVAAQAALARLTNHKTKAAPKPTDIQGNLSEDDALAHALALSMQENHLNPQSDFDLARALQASEQQQSSSRSIRNQDNKCSLS